MAKILPGGLFLTLMALCANTAHAQGGEVFGGYSYLRSNSVGSYNTNGWEGSLTGNFNRFFGVEADISDHYNNPPNLSASHSNGLSFLFGPHFAFRSNPRVNPFVHVLVGGTRGTRMVVPTVTPAGQLCPVGGCPSLGPLEQTAFTAAFGGGVDVKVTRYLWIRVIQADYLRAYFSNDTQNNLRLSFGVVFRFGR